MYKDNRFITNAIIPLLLITVLISACIKQEDFEYDKVTSANWDPNFAVPLINSSLGIEDLTGFSSTSGIEVDSSDLVRLIYKANLYSIYGYQFLQIPDQTNSQVVSLSSSDSASLYQTGSVTKNLSIIFPFAVSNGELLDSLLLRTGAIGISMSSQIPHGGSMTVTIPDATLNGNPYSSILSFNYTGSLPLTGNINDNLAGYRFNFTGNGATNQLRVNYSITLLNSSTSQASSNRSMNITTGLNSMLMAEAYGYFGQRSLSVSGDSSKIELFNKTLFGNIVFQNPKITFDLTNSFGMPVNSQLTALNAISNTGGVTPITATVPNPLPVGTPTTLGQVGNGSFFIDSTNSNINPILNQNPRYIAFNVNATSNIPNQTSNFLSDSSKFAVDVEVNLPLRGSANGFSVSDTTEFELEKIDEVKKAIFRINAENGFPASAYVQVYFTDSNLVVLDSLLSNPSDFVIASGLIDASGRVIFPNKKMKDEVFDEARLKRIYKAKKLIIFSVVNTINAPNQQVSIYSNYRLNIKIGVNAFLNVEL